jgi:ribosomal protein L9
MKKSELKQIIREEIKKSLNENNLDISVTVHKGGILLWSIVSDRSEILEDILKQKTKELREKLRKHPKIKNLINIYQLYLSTYRSVLDKKILDNSITTKKDLNLKQIELIQQFIKNEGYKIKNLFKNEF